VARHPAPTPATVKELYGSASCCAVPECGEPLYRYVPELDRLALNSTVAHIRAASPEGPRFDSIMTPEANRNSANLLVLCHFHSGLIDKAASDFSVATLQEWKAQQLAQGGGTEITDEQVEEIIRVSVSHEITLQAQVINVGGMQGGGGGAIGAGAVGGPGGDKATVNLEGQGPGGGGGALAGPGRTPPDAKRAKEGKGYIGGLDGGDTAFGTPGSAAYVYAKGGSAGGSPYNIRATTEALRISSLMMCSAVQVQGGFLHVLGGAWQSVTVLNTPFDQRLAIALVVEAGGVDVGHYTLRIQAHDPHGQKCGEARFPVVVEEAGDILRIVGYVPLTVAISDYGLYALVAATDSADLATVNFAVKRVTDGS
jgi:hypothetical protein